MPLEGLLSAALGPTIGGYRIIAELGRGGFGTVYKAIETRGLARTVAVKILRIDRQSPNLVNHFRREMEILKELHHENIVGYLDDGEDDGRLFYVMEYVDGLPITEFADRNRLSIDERLQLFTKVGEAIEFAHCQCVVHRDLKPRNILVTTDGRRAVKVLDFGIATFSDPHRMAHEGIVTISPEIAMTPEYASPEQLRGVARTSVLLDVYSLGVVLFELLAGHLPHDVDRAVALAMLAERIEQAKPKPPSQRIGDIIEKPAELDSDSRPASTRSVTPDSIAASRGTRPDRLRRELAGELDLIALMAIRPEPERRYQRVADMLDDLARVRRNLPIRARADSVMYRARKFGRRHRWPLTAASVASIGVVMAGAGALVSARAMERAAIEEAKAELARAEVAEARADVAEAGAAAALARLEGIEKIAELLVEHARGFSGTFRARSELTAMGLRYVRIAFANPTLPDARMLRRQAALANLMLEALAEINAPHREASADITDVLQQSRLAAASWRSLLANSLDDADLLVGVSQAERTIARLERAAGAASADERFERESRERCLAAARLAAEAATDAWRIRPDAITATAALRATSTLIEALMKADARAVPDAIAILREQLAAPTLPGVLHSSDDQERSELLRAMMWGHVRLGQHAFDAANARTTPIYRCGEQGRAERSVQQLHQAKAHFVEALALLKRLPPSEAGSLRTARNLRDLHQLLGRTERELVAAGAGNVEESRLLVQAFERIAARAWSRDPDIEESFSDLSRAGELDARLCWLTGDCVSARRAFERAIAHLSTERLLASPQYSLGGVQADGAQPDGFGAAAEAAGSARPPSPLARREAIVQGDLALLLDQMDARDDAKSHAERCLQCWAESRAPGAPATQDELDQVELLRRSGLIGG